MRHAFISKSQQSQVLVTIITIIVMLGILPLSASGQMTSTADSPTWDEGDWHWGAGLYGWFTSIHGELENPDGTVHEFNIPFDQIFPKVEVVMEAVATVGWRNWFLFFDGIWMTLGGDYEGTAFDLDVELKEQIYDIHVGYGVFRNIRPGEVKSGEESMGQISAVDVFLGGRYFGTQTTLIETTHLTHDVHQTEVNVSRWDPFFGARGSYSFANRWVVNLVADIGGFGIGNAAQFSYQVDANVAFRISHPLTVFAGYRVLGYNMEDDAEDWTDITQYGPKIGGALTF